MRCVLWSSFDLWDTCCFLPARRGLNVATEHLSHITDKLRIDRWVHYPYSTASGSILFTSWISFAFANSQSSLLTPARGLSFVFVPNSNMQGLEGTCVLVSYDILFPNHREQREASHDLRMQKVRAAHSTFRIQARFLFCDRQCIHLTQSRLVTRRMSTMELSANEMYRCSVIQSFAVCLLSFLCCDMRRTESRLHFAYYFDIELHEVTDHCRIWRSSCYTREKGANTVRDHAI